MTPSSRTEVPQDQDPMEHFRHELMKMEFLRVRIASYGLILVSVATFFFLAILAFSRMEQEPTWQFVTLLAAACLCLALPLLTKVNLGKEGGSFELKSPLEILDTYEAKARAARLESYDEITQQIGGLSVQVQTLIDLMTKPPEGEDPARTRSDAALQTATEPGTPSTAPSPANNPGAEASSDGADAALSEPTLAEIVAGLPPVTFEADPQKGRFGGSETSNRRRLSATAEPSELKDGWQKIRFELSSTDSTLLEGSYAHFFLHDSFNPDVYRRKINPNSSSVVFKTIAWGAFTAGVVADRGNTKLEIDLATSPNIDLPDSFRKR